MDTMFWQTVIPIFWSITWPIRMLWWIGTFPVRDVYYYYYPERIYAEARQLLATLNTTTTFEQWQTAALRLDLILPDHHDWKYDMSSPHYKHRLIRERLHNLVQADQNGDIEKMERFLTSGLDRNYGGITNPRLYERLYGGTKFVIEQYVERMVELLNIIAESDNAAVGWSIGGNNRVKMEHVDAARKTFGRTALVLQGGSVFGLYHLGVMKGLYHRGLLPRIILGTATGAIWAALMAVHDDDELEEFLDGYNIILQAFERKAARVPRNEVTSTDRTVGGDDWHWYDIFENRMIGFWNSGCVLDRDTLEDCVNTAVGDMTFEEAYARTGRLVSITIACDSPGTPNCLNYITAPNVLIRTAAMASNETDMDKAPAMILERSYHGDVQKWELDDETPSYRIQRRERQRRQGKSPFYERTTPLFRVRELWNVNHWIISQARPYFIPFGDQRFNRLHCPEINPWPRLALRRYVGRLAHLRLRQLRRIVPLPYSMERVLMDENVPGRSLTIKPSISFIDLDKILRTPSRATLDHWVRVGERSVWPCVAALKVRMDMELAIERHYQQVRRNPPRELLLAASGVRNSGEADREVLRRNIGRRLRRRSGSVESNPV